MISVGNKTRYDYNIYYNLFIVYNYNENIKYIISNTYISST